MSVSYDRTRNGPLMRCLFDLIHLLLQDKYLLKLRQKEMAVILLFKHPQSITLWELSLSLSLIPSLPLHVNANTSFERIIA